MSHHVSVLSCLIMCHCVSSCAIVCHHMPLCAIICHRVSLCVMMCHWLSSYVIECHHVSLCTIMRHYASTCVSWGHCAHTHPCVIHHPPMNLVALQTHLVHHLFPPPHTIIPTTTSSTGPLPFQAPHHSSPTHLTPFHPSAPIPPWPLPCHPSCPLCRHYTTFPPNLLSPAPIPTSYIPTPNRHQSLCLCCFVAFIFHMLHCPSQSNVVVGCSM